jgi:hypothetical protein
MPLQGLAAAYEKLKSESAADVRAAGVDVALITLASASHDFLTKTAKTQALSAKSLGGKSYFSYVYGARRSRAINVALFIDQKAAFDAATKAVFSKKGPRSLGSADAATSAIYTIAMSFCAAIDVLKKDDRKTPATYFEILIAHLIAKRIGVTPTTAIEVLTKDGGAKPTMLPTDLIFDPGKGKTKFHVPVKLSTRERVIQAWAHQRVVDGVYGARRFSGLLVVMSETKTDAGKLDVTEICLPDQWRIYQMFIAWLTRVYYLDIPAVYATVDDSYPKIDIRGFGHFFDEADAL